jgi:phosphoribosyl 1,2-cyclic phosphate phosphodiesterase
MGINNDEKTRARLIELGCADESTRFCLNHFSHNGKATYDELKPIAEKMGFIVAYDGMTAEF